MVLGTASALMFCLEAPMSDKSTRTTAEQMKYMIEKYAQAHGIKSHEATEPHLVADWAVAKGMWVRPPPTPQETLRRFLARHLRAEQIRDPQGRMVRAHHAVIYEVQTDDGSKRRSRWYRIFEAPPPHMMASLQLRRRSAFSDVHQLNIDWESYNENNTRNATLPAMDFDFNKDLEEAKQPTSYPEDPPPDEDDDGETIH